MTDLTQTPQTANAADPRAAATVYYDGACPVCSREIGWYRRMRGAEGVHWVDVADPRVAETLNPPEGYDREALLKRFTIVRGNGRPATGAEGFAALWRALGPTRLLGRLSDRQPFLWIGERLYRLFLRLRTSWR